MPILAHKPIKKKRKVLILLSVIVLAVVIVLILNFLPKPDLQKSDYSTLSWTEAFSKLHNRISKEYAFTDWKKMEWKNLYNEYSLKIKAAQDKDDFDAYYIALRSYLHEIPDGHVGCTNLRDIDDKYIGGGLGFSIARLEDNKIIISWVDEAGPAWAQGIRTGAELLKWNGVDVREAVTQVSTVFANNSATKEDLILKQTQYLVRAPIATEIKVSLINEGEIKPREVLLTAYDDKKESMKKSYPDAVVSDRLRDAILEIENTSPMPEAMVEKKTLEGNIIYIKIWGEFDADLQQNGKSSPTLELLRKYVQDAIDAKSNGIILDLRNNLGGLDEMAADILGSFYSEKTFYEYQNAYNPETGQREILMADAKTGLWALYINPAEHIYRGRIIALINTKCISSGEGIAMGIRNLPNGDTLGYYGTNGSFGLSGAEALMPGGLTVRWPSGQSLDENKKIQLDSRDQVGGVSPSIKIPITAQNAIRITNGEDVELEKALQVLISESSQ